MIKTTRFRQDILPKQPGEIARLKVRKGSDAGITFVLYTLPVSIGRGEENEFVIADLKASRKHATINRESKGRFFIQDSESVNGIQYKDRAERQFLIQHGSVFTIGGTEFEFAFAELLPELQPKKENGRFAGKNAVAPVLTATVNPLTGLPMRTSAQMSAVGAMTVGMPRPTTSAAAEAPNKTKNLVIAAVVMCVAILYLGKEQTAAKKAKAVKVEPKRDLASLLPPIAETDKVDIADTLFRSGFREYREKNYLRAKTLFETVLQVSPGHILAEKYLAEANHSIDDDIQYHLKKGRQELNTGRLKTAKGHYETVLRLLFRTPTLPEAVEAKDQLQEIRNKMRGSTS